MQKIVLYLRPTKTSPAASLRPAAMSFVRRNSMEVTAQFTERAKNGYPVLERAIDQAKETSAMLVIVNLGRLAQSVEFTRLLLQAPTFVALDDPNVNSETIHILAAIAEEETLRMSRRSKDVAAKRKARGEKLGSARPGHWEGREHLRGWRKASRSAAKHRRQRTTDYYATVMPKIVKMRKQRLHNQAIADALNAEGHRTQAGKPFCDVTILRLVRRYEKQTGESLPGIPPGRRSADDYYAKIVPRIRKLRKRGYSYQGVADWLNEHGYCIQAGTEFTMSTVERLLRKYDA